MKRRFSFWFIVVGLGLSATAQANVGQRDRGGYVGVDSLTPGPTLSGPFVSPSPAPPLANDAGASEDDQTLTIPLGGTAKVYGSTFTSCDAHTNGILICGDTSIPFFDNRQLPDSRWSGVTVIAPFWDDLTFVPGTSTITYQTFSDRVIVEWTDFARYDDPNARLSFRVTLELNPAGIDGYVLFQYLKMTGRGADGSSATIGIQGIGGKNFNQYSFNSPGTIMTGTAPAGQALQAILFDFDADGDRLPAFMERILGLNDNNPDFDGGGRDDGAELAAGLDPKVAGDDADPNDTDGDGIHDVSEAFYHTDPAKKDTDGDGIDDNVELRTNDSAGDRTFPDKADSDGDGFSDKAELDAGTDPRDPGDIPSTQISTNADAHFPQTLLDDNGNILVLADAVESGDQAGIYFYKLDPTGRVLLPETRIKPPVFGPVGSNHNGGIFARRPVSRFFGGKLYVVYELSDFDADTSQFVFLRINPGAVGPSDGGVDPRSLVEATTTIPISGARVVHEHDMAVDAGGVHLAFRRQSSGKGGFNGQNLGMSYARLDLDGNLVETRNLVTFPDQGRSKSPDGGVHNSAAPRIVTDANGVVHIMFWMTRRPYDDGSCSPLPCGPPATGIYYMTIANGSANGPFFVGGAMLDRADMRLNGSIAYIMTTEGDRHGKDLRLAIFDTAAFTAIPRSDDVFGITAAIDPSSMMLPLTTILQLTEPVNSASITFMPSGAALLYFTKQAAPEMCFLGVSPGGTPLAPPYCILSGQFSTQGDKYLRPVLLNSGANAGFAWVGSSGSSGGGNLSFSEISLPLVANFTTVPPLNHRPLITSPAQVVGVSAGVPFSFTATASDPDSGQTLTWRLSDAPAGMTIDAATGAFSWTPTSADLNLVFTPTVTVCDNASPSLCDSQQWAFEAFEKGAPVFISIPATTAVVGVPYQYPAIALDPDGENVTYALVAPSPAPAGMTLTTDGLLSWTPTAADVGTTAIVIRATDTQGLSANQSFGLTVQAAGQSHAPRFISTPPLEAIEGKPFAYVAIAADDDDPNATFTYSLTSTASGNLALAVDGTLSWKPTSKERGTVTITLSAKENDGETATQSFSVTVEPAGGGGGGCGCHVGESDPTTAPSLMLALMGLTVLVRRRLRRGKP